MASSGTQTFNGAFIEYSLDCETGAPATWTAFDCDVSEISVTGGNRDVGESRVFCGDSIINVSEQNRYEVEVSLLYKEGGADAYQALLAHHLGNDQEFGIRYSPAGNTAGNRRYTSCGCLSDVPLPSGSAEDGTPITVSLSMSGTLTTDVIP